MSKPRLIVGLVAVAVLLTAGVVWVALPPGGTFDDDDGSTFEGAIEAIAADGITRRDAIRRRTPDSAPTTR